MVYCNCDDPTWSNFWRFFHNNFRSLGLKKLIATHYAEGEKDSYAMVYEGGNDFDMELGQSIPIHSDDGFPEEGYCAGDFRSKDCITLLEESDIVCTNPPFSLFRKYVTQLVEHDKNFIIIGNQNAITYKEIFPLLKGNEMWLGYHCGDMSFTVPADSEPRATRFWIDDNGQKWRSMGNICWYTNLDIKKRHDGLWHLGGKFDQTLAHKYYEGFEWKYPKYDNYDAINVDKTKEIPIDYPGVMGVPITWLDKYNPDEFEIIDINPHFFMMVEQGLPKIKQLTLKNVGRKDPYARILIKNKNPINKADDKGY